jgi:hypothetical protein
LQLWARSRHGRSGSSPGTAPDLIRCALARPALERGSVGYLKAQAHAHAEKPPTPRLIAMPDKARGTAPFSRHSVMSCTQTFFTPIQSKLTL